MVVGRRFDEAPLITSRICGICSPNHALTSIKAHRSGDRHRGHRAHEAAAQAAASTAPTCRTTPRTSTCSPRRTTSGSPASSRSPRRIPTSSSARCASRSSATTSPRLVGGRPVHPVTARRRRLHRRARRRAELEAFADTPARGRRDAVATVELFASFDVPGFETAGEMLALTAETTTRSTRATSARSTPAGADRRASTASSSPRRSSGTATRSTPRWTAARSWSALCLA